MTTITARIPVERIAERAAALDPVRLLLALLAAPFLLIGWVAGKTVSIVWLVVSWMWAAVLVGWEQGRGSG